MSNLQEVLTQLINSYGRRIGQLEKTLAEIVVGSGRFVIEKNFVTTGLADNAATDVFRIETTNESGSTDGGGYSVFVHSLIGHALSDAATDAAVKSFAAHWGRVMVGAGTGVNTAVSEISESASAASTGATRDINTVTLTLVENSEYQIDVQMMIDLTGSGVTTAQVVSYVRLIWWGFETAPVLTEL